MKAIGFVGLGTMGIHMAGNVLQAGYPLFVYNRTASKMDGLVKQGAMACESPADVGAQCELVVTCVSDEPDVEAVILGEKGIAEGMQPGGIIVDCSTSSASLAQRMEKELAPKGIGILDAPVSGGPEGAKQARLSIMCGGKEDTFDKAKPILECMGKTIVLVGPAGAGQLTKAVNQIVGAIHLVAVAEGIALARKSGIDANKVLEAISGGAAQSWIMENRGPLMLKEEFEPARFMLKLHAKDLRLAAKAAENNDANLEFANRIKDIIQSLVDDGKGNLDHSAVYLHTKEQNGI